MRSILGRMSRLAWLELINIPLWAGVLFGLADFPPTRANLAGFAVFALLLVQGGVYWLLKVRQLRRREPAPAGLGVFRFLRLANVPVLLVALGVSSYATVTSPGRGSLLGLGLALFAVLEYLNYFLIQLMHDSRADLKRLFTVGLRRSHLARDLALPRSAGGPPRAGAAPGPR
jgi:hypothetical protein